MIAGVGTDLLSVARMTRLVQNEHFLARVFVAEERAYIDFSGHRAATAAGLFCAREAYVKALGCGLFSLPFHDYWVSHTNEGQPYFCFRHPDPAHFVHLSITHDRDFAMAFVVIERREGIL